MQGPEGSLALGSDWRDVRGHAPGLEGLSGRIKLNVENEPGGVVQIDAGAVRVDPTSGEDVETLITVDSQKTLAALLTGETPPIVVWLQGRLHVRGDRELALRFLFGLEAGSPWAAAPPEG